MYLSSGNENPQGPDWTGSSSLKKPKEHLKHFPAIKFSETAEVNVIKLDTFTKQQNLDHIDFIWEDTQGNLADIINSGQNTLTKTRFLYCEHYEGQEMYDGQITSVQALQKMLPGKWMILEKWPTEILFKNLDF